MTADGDYIAVLDRFEDDLAVLLLEREGELVDELIVSSTDLPEQARYQDVVLDVRIQNDRLIKATYDPEETKTRKEGTQARFDSLSERPPKDNEN